MMKLLRAALVPAAACLPFSLLSVKAETPASPSAEKEAPSAVKHADPAAAAKLLSEAEAAATKDPKKAIIVLDVRTPEEFAEGHLKDAKNEDISSSRFAENLAALDRSRTYLVHCAAGGRSTRSLSALQKLGFKSVIHLDGGMNAWKKAGLPVEKSAPAAP